MLKNIHSKVFLNSYILQSDAIFCQIGKNFLSNFTRGTGEIRTLGTDGELFWKVVLAWCLRKLKNGHIWPTFDILCGNNTEEIIATIKNSLQRIFISGYFRFWILRVTQMCTTKKRVTESWYITLWGILQPL